MRLLLESEVGQNTVRYGRPVSRGWKLIRAHWLDVLIAAAAAEIATEVVAREDPQTAPTISPWLAAPGAALLVLPLLGRRLFPFGAPTSLWLIAAGLSFVDGRLVPFSPTATVAGVGAAYLLGNLRDGAQARVGLAITLGAAAIVVYNDPNQSGGGVVFIPLLFAIAWCAGYAMRGRADQAEAAERRADLAEREREAAARLAVAEERARVARELHDVVAHAVSVMVLQVGAIRHTLDGRRDEESAALADVERTGRTALAEMRRLLGAMRRESDEVDLAPQPGLGSLTDLSDQVGRAGLAVRVQIEGEPYPLSRGVDVSAYRIVQEGLTNAIKHSSASRADVTVRYESDGVELEVRDDGLGPAAGTDTRTGHGLVGIRERVRIYGGSMTAGPGGQGGFVLRARLCDEGRGG